MGTPVSSIRSLDSWKFRAVGRINHEISSSEAQNLESCGIDKLDYVIPSNMLGQQFKAFDGFLTQLEKAIKEEPKGILETSKSKLESEKNKLSNNPIKQNVIFIVHGHDEVNLHRLEKLLKERFKMNCKILSIDPNAGRTLIEKLEEEGVKADFAFVLLTPDDQISSQGSEYKQARPNVIFELGWFYGKLGRNKVCVLKRRETSIHSDLSGVVWIEFIESVDEKIGEIERELIAGGLLNS